MNQRSKQLFLLLIISLISLLGLQFYFGVQVYNQQAQDLKEELNRAVQIAINKAHILRVNQINKYFTKDLEDPEIAILSLRKETDGNKLYVSEGKTGVKILSIPYTKYIKDTVTQKELKNFLINKNKLELEKGIVMFWNEELGNRLTAYNDSVKIKKTDLKQELTIALNNNGVHNNFILEILKTNNEGKNKWPRFISSTTLQLPLMKDNWLKVYLEHPNGIIFKRTKAVIFSSIAVLFLIILSFIALIKTLNKQKKLSQLKDDFITNVTHEMLTPITAQRLALERLKNDPTTKNHPMATILDQQTKRFEELINETLKVHFKSNSIKHEFQWVSPYKLIQKVINYQRSITKKTIEVKIEIPSQVKIITSKQAWIQILHNLINNAILYNDQNIVRLSFSYHYDENAYYFQVSDNGIGIPKSERSLIFEKFHRINREEIYRNKGLGIGLYFSKEVLKQIKGSLYLIKSSPKGSTFEIMLPKTKL